VDPSALIFVALAVAWAAYLVPLALKRHDEASNSRSVDRFSHTMRVLARREPVNRRSARLIVTPGRPAAEATVVTKPTSKAQPVDQSVDQPAPQREVSPAARRAASKRATKRRRNVLALILVVNLAVIGVAAFGVIDWFYVAIPVGLLAAWLVACRVMVKGERRAIAAPSVRMPMEKPGEDEVEEPEDRVVVEDDVELEADPMADTSTGMAPVNPELWDPVPVTLPTYVSKPPAARRTVRTISIDDSGVWSSGRTDADAQIAREADAADKAARKARNDDDRAVGS